MHSRSRSNAKKPKRGVPYEIVGFRNGKAVLREQLLGSYLKKTDLKDAPEGCNRKGRLE